MGTSTEISASPREPAKPRSGESLRDTRVAGACSVGGGLLLLAKSFLERSLGKPPDAATELVSWVQAHAAGLAWSDELLFFSTALLIPVVWALYAWLGAMRRPWAAFACGLLAVSIPVVFVVGMAQGRLVYPVYGIPVSDEHTVTTFASLYFGGSHEAALLLSAALIMTGVVMLRGGSHLLAMLGTAAGLAQLAVAYPWVMGPDWTLLGQIVYAAWLVGVGLTLWRTRPLAIPEAR